MTFLPLLQRYAAGIALALWPMTASADEPPAALTVAPRMLVLRTGRVVEGTIHRNSAGYAVELPTGSMMISEELVQFVAANRFDAHRQMAATIDTSTAAGRIELAGWCLKNGFYEEAANELRAALKLEPSNASARRMLTRLEEIKRPDRLMHRTYERNTRKTFDGFAAPDVKSLGGLSREATAMYASRIQPILMNRCAVTGCHGPQDTNPFRLERVSREKNTHRLVSDRNLARVLNYVNSQNVEASRLLTEPSGPHDQNGRPIFAGPHAVEQLKTLRTWIEKVAAETTKSDRSAAGEANLADSPKLKHPGDASHGAIQQTGGTVEANDEADDVLHRALLEERPDLFDPREFNARMHRKARARMSELD